MIARLANIKVSTRIALACLVPLFGLTVISAADIYEVLLRVRAARDVSAAMDLARSAALAVHELQKERSMSSGFVASKGVQFADVLPGQRLESDRRIAALREALAGSSGELRASRLGARLEEAATALTRVDPLRQSVSALSIPAVEAAAGYTRLIGASIDMVYEIRGLSYDAEITGPLATYIAMVRGKEYAGQERGTGTRGLGAGHFGADDLRATISLGAQQDNQFYVFRANATPAQTSVLKTLLESEASAVVARMRETIVTAVIGGAPLTITGPAWFEVTTARIDEMKKVEDLIAADLQEVMNRTVTRATETLWWLLAAIVALISLTGIVALIAARSITWPLFKLVQAMTTLADNDTEVRIVGTGRKNEIGNMARAMLVFRQNILERRRLETERKDAENRAAEARRAELHQLADRFESAVAGIVEFVTSASTELEASAGSLTGTAETTQRLSTVVTTASRDTSSNVQSVAAALEELANSVVEIGRQANSSKHVAADAVQQAAKADARLAELSKAASGIGEVVEMIKTIAGQTNLLALNATIEAARAGDAGRGFAVVASEVKMLATQTAKSTGEIAAQIAKMQAATEESVAAIRAIGSTIDRISEISGAIAAAVEEQDLTTRQIAHNVQQAAHGTSQVATNIGDVSRGAVETCIASEQVLTSAHELSQKGSRLKDEVYRFLSFVRPPSTKAAVAI